MNNFAARLRALLEQLDQTLERIDRERRKAGGLPLQMVAIKVAGQCGIRLDSDAHLIWMPEDTEYRPWFSGTRVTVLLADPDVIICLKGKIQKATRSPINPKLFRPFPSGERKTETMENINKVDGT